MRIKVQPQDFVVEELARLPLASKGDFAIYRVEKQSITTLQVQARIAAQLRRRSADVQAPALKDKQSCAIQHLCIRGTGPTVIEGPGYRARFVGRSQRPLRPSDLKGNRFIITLRDLASDESDAVCRQLSQVALHGVPNYFDEQRFGSYTHEPEAADRFIGKTILRRDAEGAVRAYLACPFIGDPPSVRAFKGVAARHWGAWSDLLAQAPRPSNYRSVLTYLKDHPQGYRKALNLIPRRLLSLYLVAYQSYLWNQIVARYLVHLLPDVSCWSRLTILDLSLPVYLSISASQRAMLSEISVPLPGHRAVYAESGLVGSVGEVLVTEGLELNDLKARILKRAYLPKGSRPLLVHPADVGSEVVVDEDQFPGRHAARLAFTLPAGAFATLVLKRLSLMDENPIPSSSTSAVQESSFSA
jgi:tRNA pseudouridine13 synthase